MNPVLLIIDDEQKLLSSIKRRINRSEFAKSIQVETASGGQAGLDFIEQHQPGIVLTDMRMPDIDGFEIIKYINNSKNHTYIIVMTGYSDINIAVKLLKQGVFDYLSKPFDYEELEAILLRIMHMEETKNALNESNEMFRQLAENIQEVFYLLTPDMNQFIYISPAYDKIWGQSREQLYKEPGTWFNSIHWEHKEYIEKPLRQSLSRGEPFTREFPITRSDGSSRWILLKTFPVTDENNKVYRFAAIATDITHNKQIELERSEIREKEIKIGSEIQKAVLLGQPPENIKGIDLDAMSVPSRYIDGDFYDFSYYNDNSLDILFGDVMGKGIPAALLSAALKSTFLESKVELITKFHEKKLPEPAVIVAQAHTHIAAKLIKLSSFVTLHYARINPEQNRMDFVDCGNTPIIHFSNRTNTCWRIKGTNLPMGFTRNEKYEQFSLPLEENDLLFFFSDGITETSDHNGELFGEERLARLIKENCRNKPSAIINNIKNRIISFSQSDTFKDDLSCVVIRIQKKEIPSQIKTVHHIFPGSIEELEAVRNLLRESFKKYLHKELPEEEITKIQLAVHEAATNIIKHVFNYKENNRIQFETGIYPQWLYVCLTYKGDLFDWTRPIKPIQDENSEEGYGRYVIARIMDSVLYTNDDSGLCRLYLIKKY